MRCTRTDALKHRRAGPLTLDACIVAQLIVQAIGVRTNHRNPTRLANDRQLISFVLQQHDRLTGNLQIDLLEIRTPHHGNCP
ncbi:hypothetical protein [Paenibacillus phoenicis]|uniref:hypothetical protein n=1 Tax=Paenibacillus phoenicis TaxID=554117 RepID=UPI003D275EF0